MSGRALDTDLAAALQAAHVDAFLLVQFDLDSGPLYITSTPFDVDYGGHTWATLYGLGQIEPVTETDSQQAGIAFTLSAVNDTIMAIALAEDVQGRAVTVKLVVVDGTTLRVDPVAWQGQLDVMSVEDGAAPVVRVTAEHALVAWDEPAGLTYSHADQQLLHPGDMFFEHTAAVSGATISWPTAEALKAGL